MSLFRIFVDGALFYHPNLSQLAITEAKVQENAESIDSLTLSAPHSHPYHYQSIPDLLEELCISEVDRFIREYPNIRSITECLNSVMEFALKSKRAVMHIYHSDDQRIYVDTLWRICDHAASLYVNAIMAGSPCCEKDKAIIIHYHKCACFGLLIDWIGNGMKEEVIEDIDRLCFLKLGSLEALIRRSQEFPPSS